MNYYKTGPGDGSSSQAVYYVHPGYYCFALSRLEIERQLAQALAGDVKNGVG